MDDAVEVLLALTEAHLSQSAVYAARCEQRGGYLDAPSREVLRAHQFAHRAAANKLLSRAKELQAAAGVPAGTRKCDRCDGTGSVITDDEEWPCPQCAGALPRDDQSKGGA